MKHIMIFGTEDPCLENTNLGFNEQITEGGFNSSNAFINYTWRHQLILVFGENFACCEIKAVQCCALMV